MTFLYYRSISRAVQNTNDCITTSGQQRTKWTLHNVWEQVSLPEVSLVIVRKETAFKVYDLYMERSSECSEHTLLHVGPVEQRRGWEYETRRSTGRGREQSPAADGEAPPLVPATFKRAPDRRRRFNLQQVHRQKIYMRRETKVKGKECFTKWKPWQLTASKKWPLNHTSFVLTRSSLVFVNEIQQSHL